MMEISEPLDVRRKRATWRAHHRGTKEMDWLLGRYADAKLAGMGSNDLDSFERLLALPDPDLNQWILDPAPIADRDFAALISNIRRFHNIGQAA